MNTNSNKVISINKEARNGYFSGSSLNILSLCKDIVQANPDFVVVLDASYKYINISDNYKRLVGKKFDSTLGKCISDTFGVEQFKGIIKPNLDSCIKDNKKITLQLNLVDINDNKLILETVCVPENTKNNVKRVYLYCRDITSHNDEKYNLDQKVRLLQDVLDKVPNMISIRNAGGRFVLVNKATASVYGKETHELIGKSDDDLMHKPWQTQSCIEIDTQVMEKRQELIILEETITDNNGETIWLQTTKQPFTDSSSDELYVLSVSTNITQHRLAKDKIIQSEKRFKDFAETAANIFWELDKNLNYTYLSGNIQVILGNSSVYPLGKYFDSLFVNNTNCHIDIDSYNFMLRTKSYILNFTFTVQINERKVDIFRVNAKPVFCENNKFDGYRGVIRNITEERALTDRIAYDATHDSLTGLVNRNEFDKHLKKVIRRANESEIESVLCYIDLDHFKVVNDVAGHQAGDQLLIRLCEILKDKVRASDVLARLGGDEFGIILENCPLKNAMHVCENILRHINQYVFEWDGQNFKVGASIGLAMITHNSINEILVMSQADMACYRAKELGRNQIHVAHTDDTAILERSSEFMYVSAITDALNSDRLFLMKQPIISLSDANKDTVKHYEVLSRILDNKDNIIPPNEFIKVAERYGMITSVDRYVIQKAFHYHIQNYMNSDVLVSINLSGNTVCDPQILDFIKYEFDITKIKPECVCFEITETAAISSIANARNVITELKKIGVKFALDDFGSGLSSFGYLKDLPVDYIKIDGVFVKNMIANEKDRAIVKSINEVAKIMQMKTIAEFVENDEILNELKGIGVDYAQGYGIGKPERI